MTKEPTTREQLAEMILTGRFGPPLPVTRAAIVTSWPFMTKVAASELS